MIKTTRTKPRRTGKPLPRIKVSANFRSQALKDLASECEECCFCGIYAPQTIVGCHPNGLEFGKGMGLKADDLVAFGCPGCHDLLDGRSGSLTRDEKAVMFLRGFYASMRWAFMAGKIGVAA